MDEIWKPIEGLVGYEVSNIGRVRSLDRLVTHKNGRLNRARGRVIKTIRQKSRRGSLYEKAILNSNRKQHPKFVHRLVAEAFLPADPSRPQVNHKDGNTLNNVLGNLEWSTQSENMLHAYRVLGNKPPRVRAIFVGEVRYESLKAAAEALPIGMTHLWNVLNGRKKTVRGMKARYA